MSDDRNPKPEPDFKVNDRRLFDAEGQPRAAEASSDSAPDPQAPAPPPPMSGPEGARPLPEIDFATFILSLSSSAMMHLGLEKGPEGETRKDLELARQTIDILGILRDKTKGNLTEEESRLLSELLYNLRIAFVQLSPRR